MLSAARVLATTPSSAHSASCGSTKSAVASLVNWWPTWTTCVPGVRRVVAHRRQNDDSSRCRRLQAWCCGHFLLCGWHDLLQWGLWGGWGCEVSCGGHHRPRGKTTTGPALDGAVFDIAQILAYLVHNMSRPHLYLGFGHFVWLPSFFGQ